MKFKTACDQCGSSVVGITSKLKLVNNKYLCANCVANTSGESKYFCTSCKSYSPVSKIRGSSWIELVLWLCYIIPGVIYSIWRRSGKSSVCVNCNSSTLIALDSGTHVKCSECSELVLSDARKCKHCGSALVPKQLA